jgi:hypothetical protein
VVGDSALTVGLNLRLEQLAAQTGAAAIYLMNRDGWQAIGTGHGFVSSIRLPALLC